MFKSYPIYFFLYKVKEVGMGEDSSVEVFLSPYQTLCFVFVLTFGFCSSCPKMLSKAVFWFGKQSHGKRDFQAVLHHLWISSFLLFWPCMPHSLFSSSNCVKKGLLKFYPGLLKLFSEGGLVRITQPVLKIRKPALNFWEGGLRHWQRGDANDTIQPDPTLSAQSYICTPLLGAGPSCSF